MYYGRGFGFRGSSPPWPYAGRGRGGMPRCMYPGLYGGRHARMDRPYYSPMTDQEELEFLKEESSALKRQLEEIETRITKLETAKD